MPSEEYYERKKEYIKKYQKKTYRNISFKVRLKDDQDILDILNSVPNRSEFIKSLIRNSAAR